MESDFVRFLDDANSGPRRFDGSDGTALDGSYVARGSVFGLSYNPILRFKGGYLDGGKMPAVECPGRIEFWSRGRRHREDGLPAVSKGGFKTNEIWTDGVFQGDL